MCVCARREPAGSGRASRDAACSGRPSRPPRTTRTAGQHRGVHLGSRAEQWRGRGWGGVADGMDVGERHACDDHAAHGRAEQVRRVQQRAGLASSTGQIRAKVKLVCSTDRGLLQLGLLVGHLDRSGLFGGGSTVAWGGSGDLVRLHLVEPVREQGRRRSGAKHGLDRCLARQGKRRENASSEASAASTWVQATKQAGQGEGSGHSAASGYRWEAKLSRAQACSLVLVGLGRLHGCVRRRRRCMAWQRWGRGGGGGAQVHRGLGVRRAAERTRSVYSTKVSNE